MKLLMRRHGLRVGGLAIVAALVLAAGPTASTADAAATKRCGTVVITSEGMLNRVTVRARGVSCGYARGLVLRHRRSGRLPRGWRCSAAGIEGYCRRGSQRVFYGPPFETIGPARTPASVGMG